MARVRPHQTTRIPLPHEFPAWGVDVFESHHADDWRMDLTRHDFLKLVYVLQGAGSMLSGDGDRQDLRRGELIIVPIGHEHRLEDVKGQPMSLYVVSVRPEILRSAAFDASILKGGCARLDELSSRRVETTIRRLLFEQTLEPCIAGAKVVGLTLRMLAEFARGGARDAVRTAAPSASAGERDSVARMRAYVEELQERFFEATSLDAAAQSQSLSRRRFTQLFREITQSSWLNYVRRLRVGHAKHLLQNTERTVLSIAFECGFEDLSTFYRAFKREVGLSPNQWRSAESVAPPAAAPTDVLIPHPRPMAERPGAERVGSERSSAERVGSERSSAERPSGGDHAPHRTVDVGGHRPSDD